MKRLLTLLISIGFFPNAFLAQVNHLSGQEQIFVSGGLTDHSNHLSFNLGYQKFSSNTFYWSTGLNFEKGSVTSASFENYRIKASYNYSPFSFSESKSSNFFLNYWPHMLVASIAAFFLLKNALKTDKGRYQWDKRKIKLPIIGSIIERSILARFSHSFGIILKSGIPMTTGLTLVADAVDNSFMRDKIIAMRTSIESGESLLRSAIASSLFTPLVLQMIAVGEETGRVDELLKEVGDYYEREVDYDLSTLTARIEPLLLVVVAAMVLVLALGIFTPMWDMASAMQGK